MPLLAVEEEEARHYTVDMRTNKKEKSVIPSQATSTESSSEKKAETLKEKAARSARIAIENLRNPACHPALVSDDSHK